MKSMPQRMPVCSAISKELERQRARARLVYIGAAVIAALLRLIMRRRQARAEVVLSAKPW